MHDARWNRVSQRLCASAKAAWPPAGARSAGPGTPRSTRPSILPLTGLDAVDADIDLVLGSGEPSLRASSFGRPSRGWWVPGGPLTMVISFHILLAWARGYAPEGGHASCTGMAHPTHAEARQWGLLHPAPSLASNARRGDRCPRSWPVLAHLGRQRAGTCPRPGRDGRRLHRHGHARTRGRRAARRGETGLVILGSRRQLTPGSAAASVVADPGVCYNRRGTGVPTRSWLSSHHLAARS